MFQFKQFSVDQTGCAMKINTDGVLLGALTEADDPSSILDIGTGTGVIALMLAQRFTNAQIDAVEIDESAAKTATQNFENSPFAERLKLHPAGFEEYFTAHPDKKYDLIVSNPPFYINSLQSPGAKINLAKHAGDGFFEGVINAVVNQLTQQGLCWLILPIDTAKLVKELAIQNGLNLQKTITVHSFKDDLAHREIVVLGHDEIRQEISNLTIYNDVNIYSENYKALLKPYFLAF